MNQAERETADRIKDQARRMIWVTFQREGVHRYPGADTDPKLATGDWDDVSFLGVAHRHIFHFRNDRDIEFIQFKRWLERLYQGTLQLDYKSCEMIADDLYIHIADRYPGRDVTISVAEDNENGCEIEYNTTRPSQNIVI